MPNSNRSVDENNSEPFETQDSCNMHKIHTIFFKQDLFVCIYFQETLFESCLKKINELSSIEKSIQNLDANSVRVSSFKSKKKFEECEKVLNEIKIFIHESNDYIQYRLQISKNGTENQPNPADDLKQLEIEFQIFQKLLNYLSDEVVPSIKSTRIETLEIPFPTKSIEIESKFDNIFSYWSKLLLNLREWANSLQSRFSKAAKVLTLVKDFKEALVEVHQSLSEISEKISTKSLELEEVGDCQARLHQTIDCLQRLQQGIKQWLNYIKTFTYSLPMAVRLICLTGFEPSALADRNIFSNTSKSLSHDMQEEHEYLIQKTLTNIQVQLNSLLRNLSFQEELCYNCLMQISSSNHNSNSDLIKTLWKKSEFETVFDRKPIISKKIRTQIMNKKYCQFTNNSNLSSNGSDLEETNNNVASENMDLMYLDSTQTNDIVNFQLPSVENFLKLENDELVSLISNQVKFTSGYNNLKFIKLKGILKAVPIDIIFFVVFFSALLIYSGCNAGESCNSSIHKGVMAKSYSLNPPL